MRKMYQIRVLTLLSCLFIPQFASAAIYLFIDGLEGDVTTRDYEGWIDLSSVSENISRPLDTSTGGTRTRTAAQFSDIRVGKDLDRTSPKLREALATGTVYREMKIHITGNCGDGQTAPFFEYLLENAGITGVSLSGNSGEVPAEDLSLNFERIKWTYNILAQDCSNAGRIEAEYDLRFGI